MEPIELRADESVPGRPFTSIERYPQDIAVLRVMIRDVCDVLEDAMAGRRQIVPYEHHEWRVKRLRHRLIICNQQRLLDHEELCAVGFHGERNTAVDIGPLEKANTDVVREFPNYPGVLSYSSVEITNGHWANLVLHEEPDTAEEWRHSKVHAMAVEQLSPVHYRNVRIHNARLTAGLSRDPDIEILKTKYFDFANGDQWRAQRTLMPMPGR